jgi:predicted aconitase with swiveling domain
MLMEQTLEKMNAMKLTGMVAALEQQRGSTAGSGGKVVSGPLSPKGE